MTLKILVIDGNLASVNQLNQSLGGSPSGDGYVAALKVLDPDIDATIIHPADDGPDCLPQGCALTDYDGIAWTGSALNAYADEPAVTNQIPLARASVESGVPVFGSCWGMQIVAQAMGGAVKACEKGREIGIGREILVNDAGRAHPLFNGRGPCFSAMTVHMDEVSSVPEGAVILAGNRHSAIQAFVLETKPYRFWGVQYHPEYSLAELAAIFRRYGQRLIDAGLFANQAALDAMADDWSILHHDTSRYDLAWKYGIGADTLTASSRLTELANWLAYQVRPYAAAKS